MPGSRTALGIDITQGHISMALLRKSGANIRLIKSACCRVPDGAVKNGNIENQDALDKALKKLIIRNRMYASRTAMSLTANPVLAQILDVPKDVSGNIRQFIHNEVKHYAVLPIKKAGLDFCKIKSSTATGNRRVLIVATDGQKISNTVQTLYKKGISIDVIEPAWMAYARACYEKKISKNPNTNLLFAMIDKSSVTLSLFKDQRLDFVRVQPVEQTETDSEAFLDWLGEQINAVMKFYEYGISKQYTKWLVNIYNSEGGDFIRDKKEILQSRLEGKVTLEIQTPESAFNDTPVAGENIKKEPSAIAIGLAIKLLVSANDDLNINLVPSESVLTKVREKRTLILANIAAAIVVIMILSIIFFNSKTAKVRANTNRISRDLSGRDTKIILDEKGELEKEIKDISGRLDLISDVIKTDSTSMWGLILREIGSAIPKNSRLTSIHSTEGGILLNGQAVSNDVIYLFVDSLNECKSIESTAIVGAEDKGESNGLVNFSINCILKQ